MRRPLSLVRWPVVLVCLVCMLAGCNHQATYQLCCDDDPIVQSKAELQYCRNHTDAVLLWVQVPSDTSAQRTRMVAFTTLSTGFDTCTSVACIEGVLQASTSTGGLWDRYQDEHEDAEDQLERVGAAITDAHKADLIKCGFLHARQVGIQ